MRYQIQISEKARNQLRALPKELRRNIGQRLEALRDGLHGDVKKLASPKNRYRLRIGPWRVLFLLEGNAILVYGVKDRKEAYE